MEIYFFFLFYSFIIAFLSNTSLPEEYHLSLLLS